MHYAIEPMVTPEGTTVRYTIETQGSSFTVKAFAAGVLSAFAHSPIIGIPDFKGEILLTPDAPENSSLRIVAQSASLVVTDDISDKDREEINRKMHDEVLESDSYPEVIYESSKGTASKTGESQYWIALNGELTLHGVKRNQPVSARVSVNGSTLRAVGEFAIRQSDYEIAPVSAMGGAIKLKDELRFSFNISALKRD